MKVLIFLLQKEFRQIFRDKPMLAMMLIMPTIQLIIMPQAANFDVKNVNIALVDNDHSTYSQKLVNKIGSSGYFRFVGAKQSYKEALQLIENSTADLVLEIPNGFEKNLVREGQQKLNISIDAINGTKSSIGGAYLNQVIADFNNQLDINTKAPNSIITPPAAVINVTYSDWFNTRMEYKYFMVPAILVLLLTIIGGNLTALNIVKEKEIGTIEQINVTPIKKWQFIFGKLIPFWIVGMIVFTIGLLVAFVVYGIIPKGSFVLLYSFASVYLIALLGLGLFISTFSNTQIQAMFASFFFMMIFILMSGYFTAVESMPPWARQISMLTPVTHFIAVVRLIILKGSSFADVKTEFFYEIIFAIILNTMAILNYRKTS